MKKRFLSALLGLCLLTGMHADMVLADSITVDTVDSTSGDGYDVFDPDSGYTKEIDIYAQALDSDTGTKTVHRYKVELVWGDMAFAWGTTKKVTKTWSTTEHKTTSTTTDEKIGWRILNEEALSLAEGTDATYASVTEGTDHRYVLIFNHSDQPVNANVKIEEINAGGEDAADDKITASLTSDNTFGTTGISNQAGGFDYELGYDEEGGILYSKDNGTAAAAYVELANEPAKGALNDQTDTTVARVTVTLSIPE